MVSVDGCVTGSVGYGWGLQGRGGAMREVVGYSGLSEGQC
jgi:hypothetical protein